MTPFILLLLGVSGVYCDNHYLSCFKTITTPGSGLPAYTLVVYFNDQQIVNYTSDTQQYLPKVEWLKKLDPEYWEWETRRTKTNQPFNINHLQKIMNRFNHTGGFHVLQSMYGCELRDDGSTAGYNTFGYDGREFMFLDTERAIWIPSMNEAQLSTQQYNSPEVRRGEVNKRDVEIVCVEYLKKFIDYGREDLEKRVRPEVKVWSRSSNEVTKLYCLVYGFYPRPVDVKWMRNGTDHIISDEASPILPHPDGTYQTRISVEVAVAQGDYYSCYVDHSSLEEPTIVIWDPNMESGDNQSVVVGFVIAVAVTLFVGFGVILYKRQRGGRKKTDNTPETVPCRDCAEECREDSC